MITLERFRLAVLLCIAATPAFASSSGSIRDLSRTTFRACPPPSKLRERYTVFSTPYGETVEIACLRDPTFATWIFSAESQCSETECGPKLADPPEGVAPNTDRPSRVITYTASQYTVEDDCTLGNGQNRRGVIDAPWSCKRSKTVSPRAPIRVEATGATTSVADVGEGVIRDLTATTLRACPSGDTLREHYHVSHIDDLYGEEIEIACASGPKSAAWIFVAGSRFDFCATCGDKRLPQLAVPAQHRDDLYPRGSNVSPAVVAYDVSKYLVGRDCTLETQRNLRDVPDFWACKTYDPPSDKPLRVQTVGPKKEIADDADDAPKLPFRTSEPDGRYTRKGVYDED